MLLKSKIGKFTLAICLAAVFLQPAKAADLFVSTRITAATNLPAVINVGSASNQTSWIPVTQGRGLSLGWSANTSAGTSNALMYIFPSVDGTNAASASNGRFWILTNSLNGTTVKYAVIHWNPGELDGFRALNIGTITNCQGATGIITNNGVLISRPNI